MYKFVKIFERLNSANAVINRPKISFVCFFVYTANFLSFVSRKIDNVYHYPLVSSRYVYIPHMASYTTLYLY